MSKNIESYSAAAESGNFYERRSRWSKLRLAARTSPYTARFGLIVIAIYVFVAIFAPWLAPYGEAQIFPAQYEPWSSTYIFGTDQITNMAISFTQAYFINELNKNMKSLFVADSEIKGEC